MKDIHIGKAIEDRLVEIRMSKSEFGRKIGVPQQNVNRILEHKAITTDKLQLISEVLDFDFFALYQEPRNDINVVASGDSSIAALYSDVQTKDCAVLQERIRNLELLLAEKERMIQYLIEHAKIEHRDLS